MPKPANPIEFPTPQGAWTGNRFLASTKRSLQSLSKLWRPAGTNMAADASVLSLVALRLVNRITGVPYSADEFQAAVTETALDIGNTGTAMTLELVTGTVKKATLTGNCTFTMPPATFGKSFTLLLATGAGSFTGAFTGVDWGLAGTPTITATAGKLDVLKFTSNPSGTAWYGTIAKGYTFP